MFLWRNQNIIIFHNALVFGGMLCYDPYPDSYVLFQILEMETQTTPQQSASKAAHFYRQGPQVTIWLSQQRGWEDRAESI